MNSNLPQPFKDQRLMRRQTSVRLKVTTDQRIDTLMQQFPDMSKSRIINDLLEGGLIAVEVLLEKSLEKKPIEEYLK